MAAEAIRPTGGERRARAADIPRLIEIRGAVRENRLADPRSVTEGDYHRFVAAGRVWVTEQGGRIIGFAASDPADGTIWALFVDPACEGMGIGSRLLDLACGDLRREGHARVWLSTDPGTRAEALYLSRGWTALGLTAEGEMAFARDL